MREPQATKKVIGLNVGADVFNAISVKQLLPGKWNRNVGEKGEETTPSRRTRRSLKCKEKPGDKLRLKFKKGLPRPQTPEQIQQFIAVASKNIYEFSNFWLKPAQLQ
ncbi:MAG: hypothetical protein QXR42_05580 [Candidatus Bathyarchaeia archaeon]